MVLKFWIDLTCIRGICVYIPDSYANITLLSKGLMANQFITTALTVSSKI